MAVNVSAYTEIHRESLISRKSMDTNLGFPCYKRIGGHELRGVRVEYAEMTALGLDRTVLAHV